MQDNLPITIVADNSLFSGVKQALTIMTQLEAWLNFETLTANWYANERTNIDCLFLFISPASFAQKSNEQSFTSWQVNQDKHFMLSFDQKKRQYKVLCTLDNTKLEQLAATPTLLEPLLKQQLHSIINLIATEQKLNQI